MFKRWRFRRAIQRGDVAAVRKLLGQYPRLAKRSDAWNHFTPWDDASAANAKIMGLILEAGGNPDSEEAKRALSLAANNDRREIVQTLLAHGVDVNNTCGAYGMTPLHRAADHCYAETVAILLAHGADVNAMDQKGNTPLDLANKSSAREPTADRQRTINLLRLNGAKVRPKAEEVPKPVPGGGSALCVACDAAKQWWTRKTVMTTFSDVSVLGTGGQYTRPADFAGVCKNCRDGFCTKHAPDRLCPKCGSQLKG